MTYPILVEQYTAKQALTIVCEACHAEAVIHADDILNEGLFACPAGCPGSATYKYEEADRCGGCGRLGFYDIALKHCCSRACMLQTEYAATLKGATA